MAIDYQSYGFSGSGSDDLRLLEEDTSTDAQALIEREARVLVKRTNLNNVHEVADFRAAISFLQGEPGIDPDRIGIFGSSNGGTIVTAGGLVFIGGSMDERFHAFDKSTGKLLWEYQLPAGGYATPCTYEANGKQYVVIAAGGGGKLKTKSGDAFVAFALP